MLEVPFAAKKPKRNGHAHSLSSCLTNSLDYRSEIPKPRPYTREHEQSPAARKQTQAETDAKPSRKPAVAEAGLSYIHMYHAWMPVCLLGGASVVLRESRFPVTRLIRGRGTFFARDHAVWCCCRHMSCREMQVRLGEAAFPRAIDHPRAWRLESWGRAEVAVSACLVEHGGHVKVGNLAAEHRRRKKP
jgi:hypothetical protein